MTDIEEGVVRRKLAVIQAAVLALESIAPISIEEYRRDLWRRKGTERLLQEAIEAAVDLATHLVVSLGRPAPADLFSSFVALSEVGVIDEELARALAPAAGLRNRLVHEYDDIDDAKVLAAVGEACRLLPQFAAAVEGFVSTKTPREPPQKRKPRQRRK